jgi:hypothetical protein
MIGLAFALYLAHTLFEVRKVADMPLHRKIPFTLLVSIALLTSGCGGGSSSSSGGGGTTPPPPPSTAKEWTWMSGSSTVNATGVYGSLGVPASGNVPGGRSGAVSWIDGSGNLWLFGGYSRVGVPASADSTYLNDLWEFNATSKEWAWVSGGDTGFAWGVYGSLGVPAAGNVPGARQAAANWIDKSGNLWLFGGYEQYEGGSAYLNDLWEFNPTSKGWTWVSGSNGYGSWGEYGPQGIPGARVGAASWIDSSGNLWLFGGNGEGEAENCVGCGLNDLWEFNPTSKVWTWVSGSDTESALGSYGTQGTPGTGNVPGARSGAVSWIDGSGNLWLYGGNGYDSVGINGLLNDLWEYSPTAKTWTWVSGSKTANAAGVYGNLGTPAATNVPGARSGAVSWIDGSGNLWLFGGGGNNSTVTGGDFNDLWEFSPTSKGWIWMGGSDAANNAPGVYGSLGVPATTNVPGARSGAVSWIDGSGDLWFFGGDGYDSTGTQGYLNDLWHYQP